MKNLRHLIVLNAFLLLLVGFGMLVAPRPLPVVYTQYQVAATIRLLATIVGSLGLVLLLLRNQILSDERRRLALGLCAANTLIAVMAMMQETGPVWVKPLGWVLLLVPLGLAVAMGWAGLRPAAVAEEAEILPIPDELRRSWLRQLGEAAVQEERNRLSRDLHDSIKQQLFTINVSTAAAQELWEQDPERAKAALVDVRRSAREAMVEMQALLHQLQPRALAAAGLVEGLREQCEALGYRTGADVSLELGEAIPDDRLPPGAQETLFRIAQEALANVARHARARKVRVWLGRQEDSALLRIEDDGQGFDPAMATSGMGLRNLRERAESLSGELEIQSASGSGTMVYVQVPLTPLPPLFRAPENGFKALKLVLVLSVWIVLFWVERPIVSSNQSYDDLMVPLVFVIIACQSAANTEKQLRAVLEFSPAASEIISSLRYRNYREGALWLLVAAWWTPWYWRFEPPGWHPLTITCIVVSLVLAGMTIAELVRFHRVSQIRRWWLPRSWVWPAGWEKSGYSILFVVLVGCAGCVMGLPLAVVAARWLLSLEPIEILPLLFGAAVLGYILTRQPRREGTPA